MPPTQKTIIGVMGPGEGATENDKAAAFTLGKLIAEQGWVLLSGERDCGVMDASCKGAKSAGGLTIGILPGTTRAGMSDAVDIPIITGTGNARNAINVLSCDAIIGCGMGAGTASEVALALKSDKFVILLNNDEISQRFFRSLAKNAQLEYANSPQQAVALIKQKLSEK